MILKLYILIFLHQTATLACCVTQIIRCISLYSYIKPQPSSAATYPILVVYPYIPTSNRNLSGVQEQLKAVVYPYIPTSNRNLSPQLQKQGLLYILIFLHQTATKRGISYI